jgi:hypothetical protein
MAELPDGRWTGCRIEGRLLSIIFNAQDKDILTSSIETIGKARGN